MTSITTIINIILAGVVLTITIDPITTNAARKINTNWLLVKDAL